MSGSVVVKATSQHTASFIFLHGCGEIGHKWAALLNSLKSPNVNLIFPTASIIPVTLMNNSPLPAWYNVFSRNFEDSLEDEEGILSAVKLAHNFIMDEIKSGIPSNRIILGGFSQGGAIALRSAITFPESLAGVVMLSSYFPLLQKFPGVVVENKNTPVLICHGDDDPIVTHKAGQIAYSLLNNHMTNVEFKTYPNLGHTVSIEEKRDIKFFIQNILKP